jgi:hypothetical protein
MSRIVLVALVAFVLGLPSLAHAEFLRIEMKIFGMD